MKSNAHDDGNDMQIRLRLNTFTQCDFRRNFSEFCGAKILEFGNKRYCAKLYILDFLKVVVNRCKNQNKCSVRPGCLTPSAWVHGCMGENSGTHVVPSVTWALGLLARVKECCFTVFPALLLPQTA